MCSRVWRPSRVTVAQPALVTGVGGSVPSTSPRPWESARGLVLWVSARCCVRSCPGAGLRAPQDSEPALPVRGAAAPCAGLVLAAPRPGQCAPRDRPVRPPLLAAEQQRLLQGPRKRLQSAAERGGLQGQPGTGTSSASLFRGEDGLREFWFWLATKLSKETTALDVASTPEVPGKRQPFCPGKDERWLVLLLPNHRDLLGQISARPCRGLGLLSRARGPGQGWAERLAWVTCCQLLRDSGAVGASASSAWADHGVTRQRCSSGSCPSTAGHSVRPGHRSYTHACWS